MLRGLVLLGCRRGRRWARLSAITLVVDEAVHPIRRHYTPSDRVDRDERGVSRRNGCSASRSEPGRACARACWLRPRRPVGVCRGGSARGWACFVGGGAPDPVGIAPLLIGCSATDRVHATDRVQRCTAGPVGCRHVQCQRGNPRASLLPMRCYTRSGRFNPF